MIDSVLAVCIGNICRSPAAEVLLRQRLPGLQVASAGLQALDGYGIDPMMRQVLQAAGAEPGAHSARTLAPWMLAQASLVLVMDTAQKQHIERQYPAARGRVFRLGEPLGLDIPDPYRQDRETFERVHALIDQGVQRWSERIQALGYASAVQA